MSSPSENIERIANNNHPDFLIVEPSALLEEKEQKVQSRKKASGSEIIKIAQIRNIKAFSVKNQ